MILPLIALIGIANAAVIERAGPLPNIVIGNDDGWATANIRTFYKKLKEAGYDAIISAPAENKSGTGSLQFPPIPLITAGEFNTIPIGAPAFGPDKNDGSIFYVNSFPGTAVKYGIEQFAPSKWGNPPGLVVTGVNVGDNVGIKTQFSGTVGAAALAVTKGIPAIAFSGAGGTQHIYTEADPVADVYAQVATTLVQKVVASGTPYLPNNVGLNINIPVANDSTCQNAADYKFVLSRVNVDLNPFTKDVNQCGSDHLPTESSVLGKSGCYVSISAFWGTSKLDVDKDTQKIVQGKFADILTCLP